MRPLARLAGLGAVAFLLSGGINWKTVWLEPNPVNLRPGASIEYKSFGIHGADGKADLTKNPHLKVVSSDPSVVAVDRHNSRLIGKAVGRAEIRISFSECTSIVQVRVRSDGPD